MSARRFTVRGTGLLLAAMAVMAEPPAAQPSRLEAFRERLKQDRYDAAALQLGREAIAEARWAGDDAGLRDALLDTSRIAMSVQDFEAGVRLLEEEAWPTSASAQSLLHVLVAEALVERARPLRPEQGLPVGRELARELEERRLHELFLTRLAEVERHLDAAWALRSSLPLSPAEAFGPAFHPGKPSLDETARDVLSVAIARMLAKREAWRGRDAFERAPLQVLLSPPEVCPGNASVHPLVRALSVLRDLEAWHLASGRRGHALGAVRVAGQTLAAATWGDERVAVLEWFEIRLRRDRDLPAFSAGMADLAGLNLNSDRSLAMLRPWGRALARECQETYPESEGATLCGSLLARGREVLELSGMSHDGPGERSLRLRTRGLPVVYLSAFRVDPASARPSIIGEGSERFEALQRVLRESTPTAVWTVHPELPDDSEPHSTWITPPLGEKGAYVIAASARPDLSARENLLSATALILTDLVLVAHTDRGRETEVVAVSGSSGEPRAGVRVQRLVLGDSGDYQLQAEGSTKTDGRVVLPPPPHDKPSAVVGSQGSDLAFLPNERGEAPERERASMLIADKHRYRPREKVRFVYLGVRRTENGGLLPDAGRTLSVTLADGTGRELRRLRPTTDAFGLASGALTVPPGRPSGVWSIREDYEGSEAEFEVLDDGGMRISLEVPPGPLQLGQSLTVRGRVIGPDSAAVAGARVAWSLQTQGFILDLGETTVHDDWTFEMMTSLPATRPESELSVRALLSTATCRLLATAEVPVVEPNRVFIQWGVDWVRARETFPVTATRQRDSVPAPGTTSYRVVRLLPDNTPLLPGGEVWPAAFGSTADDRRSSRHRKEANSAVWTSTYPESGEVAAGTVTHGEDGKAHFGIPDLAPGLYRIDLETADGMGGKARWSKRFLVLTREGAVPFGAAWIVLPSGRPGSEGTPWEVLAHCGFPDQLFFLEHYRNERRLSWAGHRQSLVEAFPVRPETEGAHKLRFWCVRDFQLIAQDSDWRVTVGSDSLRLSVTGGAREGLRVTVSDPAGKQLLANQVEVLVMVAPPIEEVWDLAVDPPEPRIFGPRLEGLGGLKTCLSETMGVSLASFPYRGAPPVTVASPGWLQGLPEYGMRDPAALSSSAGGPPSAEPGFEPAGPVPSVQPDPLAFQPHLSPGADGVLHVSLPKVPLSRTIWILAVSKEMKYGFAEVSIDANGNPTVAGIEE